MLLMEANPSVLSLKSLTKLCHPDRSAAEQAEWRDLLCYAANFGLTALTTGVKLKGRPIKRPAKLFLIGMK